MTATNNSRQRTEKRKADNFHAIEGLRMYSLTELETILGVTHRTLLNYIYSGKIEAVKIAQRWKVSEDEIRRFINAQQHSVSKAEYYRTHEKKPRGDCQKEG